MKNLKIISIIILTAICLYAPKILAIGRNPFPETSAVQPIPDQGAPNIAGNIDWPKVGVGTTSDAVGQTWLDDGITDNPVNNSAVNNPNEPAVNPNLPTGSSGNFAGQNFLTPQNQSSQDSPATQSGNDSPNNGQIGNQASNLSTAGNFDQYGPSQQNSGSFDNTNQNTGAANQVPAGIDETPQSAGVAPRGEQTSNYVAWTIFFLSFILLVVAFIIWKLKKAPDDVNQ